jgi:hypothetical protein
MSPVVATTGAAESLIAQLHSQSKQTTPRRENRKVRHEIEILKATSDLSKTPKRILLNLVRLSLYSENISWGVNYPIQRL